jgi:hypothetical protein
MTLNEMLVDLNSRIGSEPEVSNANMTKWINQAMQTFCAEHDFAWLEKKSTTSAVASLAEYALPPDFKRIVELQVNGTSASPEPYTRTSHEMRVLRTAGEQTFSVYNNTVTLNPTPSVTGSNNIELWYIKKPINMVEGTDSPSDSDIASMPEEYHEALVIYAFATYNSYDEEMDEARALMGNPRNPVPGTYYYFVDLAKKNDAKQKRGQRSRMISKQEFSGYVHPNQSAASNNVLGI